MASIDRRNGGYRVRYRTPDGLQRNKSFTRMVDAKAFAATTEAGKVKGDWIDPSAGRQMFEAFADEWATSQDWKATSRESWSSVRARLLTVLGGRRLQSIDRLMLQSAQQTLSAKYARSTVELTMSYAGTIMRAAHANGRIGRDPTRGLRAPKTRADEPDGKVGPDQVPTRAEALALLEGAPPRYRAAIALGLAGLRVGEVLGMAADRIALDTRSITVDQQVQRVGGVLELTTPKAEKTRVITVPMVVAVELRRHLRDHQGDGLLFRGVRGTPMMRRDQFYDSAWHPALKAAGLWTDGDTEKDPGSGRFVFHSLRHFCASTLLAEGAPLTAVAGHLGDTVDTVSRTYVHWLRDDREVPAAVLDRVLAPTAVSAQRRGS
jgi:integrase